MTYPDAYELSNQVCPWCGHEVPLASEVTERGELRARRPSPGDVTACIRCGEFSVFTDDLSLTKPDDETFLELANDPRVQAIRKAWTAMKDEKP
jgi:hypothetical protein